MKPNPLKKPHNEVALLELTGSFIASMPIVMKGTRRVSSSLARGADEESLDLDDVHPSSGDISPDLTSPRSMLQNHIDEIF